MVSGYPFSFGSERLSLFEASSEHSASTPIRHHAFQHHQQQQRHHLMLCPAAARVMEGGVVVMSTASRCSWSELRHTYFFSPHQTSCGTHIPARYSKY
eukprot:scaffold8280_cov123-Skeletonema_dohrnii-CCMP3373.AAC.3